MDLILTQLAEYPSGKLCQQSYYWTFSKRGGESSNFEFTTT